MSKKAVRMLQSLGVITFAVVLGICCMQTVNPNNEMSDTTEVHLTAGVTDAFVESDGASGILVAGVSGQMHDYLGTLDPMLQEKSTIMVASGSYASDTSDGTKQDQICGYVNIGVSNIEDALNVREAASIDSSVVGKMTSHAACEILGVEGEWTHISSGKVEGYVKSEFLYTGEEAKAIALQEKKLMATVTCDVLRVREEPTTESGIIINVANGEDVEVVSTDMEGWVQVKIDNDTGYVAAEYVELSEKLKTALSMKELMFGDGVSETRVSLCSNAIQYVGNPYVWGGTSLTRGADCSGFVLSIYSQYGIYLPHSSRAQAGYGTRISASEAKPGDLFFYGSGSYINHVAIYIGNGQIVHASNETTGIIISNAFYRSPICVTRLLGN